MKKWICVILCLMTVVLCTACGEKKDADAEIQASTGGIEHPLPASWFDDAVFVGDSITLKLSYYCEDNPSALGKAEFFCAGSLGYNNALWDIDDYDAVHPYYRGEVALSEDCAAKTGATKVFIMLGMNDLGIYGIDGTCDACAELVNRIKSHTPDVEIYLQSVTPILAGYESGDLTNANIVKFNERLKQFCEDNGYQYIDINSIMRDDRGNLTESYCSDPDAMGIHFTDSACAMWVDYLKNHV